MITVSRFRPAWWLRGAHAQTIWPGLMRRTSPIKLVRERLELPDEDFIDLAWTARGSGPIVIVLHGLEGSLHSHYVPGMLSALDNHGWRAVLMHFRGCSGEHNRKARSYHSGESGDLRFLVETLVARHPQAPLAAVGFSLGGNVLLKYLGETGPGAKLAVAAAISVPFVLASGADRLNRGFSKIYQRYLIKRLQNKITGKFKTRNDAPFSLEEVPEWNTFRLFDNFVTAPLHGFRDCDDYYRRSSCRQFLKSIRVPTLIVHAEDDPFLAKDAIPESNELPDQVNLEVSARGGHAGFVGGRWPWKPCYWLEQRIPEFLHAHLD